MVKKLLVLTPRFPYPPTSGDKARIFHICEFLAQQGFELTLLSFVQNETEARAAKATSVFARVQTVLLSKRTSYLQALLGFCSSRPLQLNYYRSKAMQTLVDRELATKAYDGVLVHLIRMAPYVIERNDVCRVLEMTDAISLTYSRSQAHARWKLFGLIYRIEKNRVRAFERACVEQLDRIVVISSTDRAYLLKTAPPSSGEKIIVVPNGVSVPSTMSAERDPNLIVFIGNMRSLQNQDAVFYFINLVYPLVRQRYPQAKLRVVGEQPPKSLLRLNGTNGIEVTGKVTDVFSHVRDASVSICPNRVGSGVLTKLLESMAFGIPVVTAPLGAIGMTEGKTDEHFLVADTPEEFAEATVRLLGDPTLWKHISVQGKQLIEKRYQFQHQLKQYTTLFG